MKTNLNNPVTNKVKQVKVGFSWTTFFWGFFPALFRGDWKWFVIIFLIDIITGSFTYGFGSGVVGIIFAFFYNELYITDLMNNGFVPADDVSKNILLSKGISIINADTNESIDSTNKSTNVYVQNKPLYKRVWFVILAIFIALFAVGVIIGAVKDTNSNSSSQIADSSIRNDSKSSSESENDSSVPSKYKSALNKTKSYQDNREYVIDSILGTMLIIITIILCSAFFAHGDKALSKKNKFFLGVLVIIIGISGIRLVAHKSSNNLAKKEVASSPVSSKISSSSSTVVDENTVSQMKNNLTNGDTKDLLKLYYDQSDHA